MRDFLHACLIGLMIVFSVVFFAICLTGCVAVNSTITSNVDGFELTFDKCCDNADCENENGA